MPLKIAAIPGAILASFLLLCAAGRPAMAQTERDSWGRSLVEGNLSVLDLPGQEQDGYGYGRAIDRTPEPPPAQQSNAGGIQPLESRSAVVDAVLHGLNDWTDSYVLGVVRAQRLGREVEALARREAARRFVWTGATHTGDMLAVEQKIEELEAAVTEVRRIAEGLRRELLTAAAAWSDRRGWVTIDRQAAISDRLYGQAERALLVYLRAHGADPDPAFVARLRAGDHLVPRSNSDGPLTSFFPFVRGARFQESGVLQVEGRERLLVAGGEPLRVESVFGDAVEGAFRGFVNGEGQRYVLIRPEDGRTFGIDLRSIATVGRMRPDVAPDMGFGSIELHPSNERLLRLGAGAFAAAAAFVQPRRACPAFGGI